MPAHHWDTYVVLAVRFGWTPQEADRLDPEFVDEIMAYLSAAQEAAKK